MATVSFEIELELEGSVSRYRPATWMDPAEGGEVEDLDLADAGVLNRVDRQWVRTSFLDGVDRKNPEVRKLLDNLLNLVWREAEQAIVDDDMARAA